MHSVIPDIVLHIIIQESWQITYYIFLETTQVQRSDAFCCLNLDNVYWKSSSLSSVGLVSKSRSLGLHIYSASLCLLTQK